MVANGQCKIKRRVNQIGNLHRSETTHWSCHFNSICSLIDMYGAIIIVLESIAQEGFSNSMSEKVSGCLNVMRSFKFIFILHSIYKIIGINDLFC
jgi:hypothetical protein